MSILAFYFRAYSYQVYFYFFLHILLKSLPDINNSENPLYFELFWNKHLLTPITPTYFLISLWSLLVVSNISNLIISQVHTLCVLYFFMIFYSYHFGWFFWFLYLLVYSLPGINTYNTKWFSPINYYKKHIWFLLSHKLFIPYNYCHCLWNHTVWIW